MKNQIKKSISFIMAVLMILSCWVWVAPDKASAAGMYSVTLSYTVDNKAENGGHAKVWYYPFNADGSLNTSNMVEYTSNDNPFNGLFSDNDGTYVEKRLDNIPGWPCKVYIIKKGKGGYNSKVRLHSIKVNDVTVLSGTWTFETTGGQAGANREKNFQWDGKGGDEGSATRNWDKPTFTTLTSISADPATVSKYSNNSGRDVTSTLKVTGGIDQYGVACGPALFPSVSSDKFTYDFHYTNENGQDDSLGSEYVTFESGKIVVKPAIQQLFKDPITRLRLENYKDYSGVETIYVNASYNGGKKQTADIKLTMPTYTASFYPNGGTIGTSATNNTSDDNNPITVGVDGDNFPWLYYGGTIGSAPAYATKPGMDFVGFYSKKNEDLTGKQKAEDYFKGLKFNGGNAMTTVDTNGSTKWYAAWESSKIRVSFIVNNQLLGAVEGRYNNSMLGRGGNMYGTVANLNEELYRAYTASGKDAIEFDANTHNPKLTINGQEYTFVDWEIVDAYDFGLVGGSVETILKGDVTFRANFVPSDEISSAKKVNVTFHNGYTNAAGQPGVLATDSYTYRDQIKLPATPPSKSQDNKYEYEFVGWAEYVGSPFYAVDENSNDESGAYIHYTPADTGEFIATKDVAYVPVFRMIPREYKVTFQYKLDGGMGANIEVGGYHYGDSLTLPAEIKESYTDNGRRYFITSWSEAGSVAGKKNLEDITVTKNNMTVSANYDKNELASYTIRFFDMYGNLIGAEYDEEGNLLNNEDFIHEHNTTVTAPTVGDAKEGDETTYDIPYTIDTEDALYTFTGWSPSVSSSATADIDYTAVYTSKEYADVYFRNYDGELIYKVEGKFVGDVIPAYSNIVDGEISYPEREEDVYGTYRFTGWKDSNGTVVAPGTDVFTGDIHLTAQFERTDKYYTVEFLNGDEVVSRQKLKYGEAVTTPANPVKEADDLYEYDFKAWDSAVSPACYGNATYNALFRRTPIYYEIVWFKDNKLDTVRTSIYAFGARIQAATAPADPTTYGDAAQGYSWAFAEWVRCDEYGNPLDENGVKVSQEDALKYERGMTMPKEKLYFYPVYTQQPTMVLVEFYNEDGTKKLGETKIPYNGEIDKYAGDFVELAQEISDDNFHYDFSKWVKRVDGTELATNENNRYIVTEPIEVKAVLNAEKHNFEIYDVIVYPTCTESGAVKMKCSSDYCTLPAYEEIVPAIDDNDAPTAQVYMGSQKWTMNEYNGKKIDYSEKIYVGADSATIINAEDVGTRSKPWNVEGTLSRGVGKIDYYVSEKVLTDPGSQVSVWTNIYDYSTVYNEVLEAVLAQKGLTRVDYEDPGFGYGNSLKTEIDSEVKAVLAGYKANATGILGDLGLENGKEYIIYFRISDREVLSLPGDVNISYMSTGTLHYGTVPAEVTISGNGYGSKFCSDATITVSDDTDGLEIYIDGEKQNTSAEATQTSVVCDETGVHTVTVIDRNGNKTTKTFEIRGGHSYRNYTVAATCDKDGSRYDLCTVCGVKANTEVLDMLGHSYVNYTEKAATCDVDGSRTYVCDNNCGSKLTVGPAYNTDKFAECGVTAAELKHLEATGEHTYAKATDEAGKETSELLWVIDKAATCMVDGRKHTDCTVCGYRYEVVIAKDTVNGHKFYRARVEKGDEATCTKDGIKSETCRYCGIKQTVETIPALGHTAGEYRVITPAECETKGSKILTCSVCKVDIGEKLEDENGKVTFNGLAVEIPETGHAWKTSGDPYQKPAEEGQEPDGKWYQNYVCDNNAEHTKTEETEYEVKQQGTVTFMNGDGDTAPQSFTGFVGETVLASDVTVPTKAADATYKYSFAHWASRTGAGTEADPYVYTEVKFPVTVTEGTAVYYAVFNSKNVNYAITYMNSDGTEFDKKGYLHNGETVELIAGPEKAATVYNTFEFAAWATRVETVVEETVTDENGNNTTIEKLVVDYVPVGKEITINGANVVLYATYSSAVRRYAVTYANSLTDTIESFLVDAGSAAHECGLEPTKKADSKHHYVFDGWNKAAQLAEVTGNIYTTPNFTPVVHTLVEIDTPIEAETCTTNRITKKTCACGYETDEIEVKNTMLGHNWSTTTTEVDGKLVRICQNTGCNETTSDTRTFTVYFYYSEPADENARPTIDVPGIAWGTTIDPSRIPVVGKDEDDQYEYIFKGWKLRGTADTELINLSEYIITSDCDLVAVFESKARIYKVTFSYEHSHKEIKSYMVAYGSGVVFDGETPRKENDTDEYDSAQFHYIFSGWSKPTDNIKGDIIVYAKFDEIAHTYGELVETGAATCQQGAGYRQVCTYCGYEKLTTGKPIAHKLEEVERKAATPESDGYIKQQCVYEIEGVRCDYVDIQYIKYEDATSKLMVSVFRDGAVPAVGIKVIAQKQGNNPLMYATTNSNGVATLTAEKDCTYFAWVEIDGEQIMIPLTTDANGNYIGVYTIESESGSVENENNCNCSCHSDTFWGGIFRFFHKIIRFFTGSYKCCADPDAAYGG